MDRKVKSWAAAVVFLGGSRAGEAVAGEAAAAARCGRRKAPAWIRRGWSKVVVGVARASGDGYEVRRNRKVVARNGELGRKYVRGFLQKKKDVAS